MRSRKKSGKAEEKNTTFKFVSDITTITTIFIEGD